MFNPVNQNKYSFDKLDILTPKNKYRFKKKNNLNNEISKDNSEENLVNYEKIFEKNKNIF